MRFSNTNENFQTNENHYTRISMNLLSVFNIKKYFFSLHMYLYCKIIIFVSIYYLWYCLCSSIVNIDIVKLFLAIVGGIFFIYNKIFPVSTLPQYKTKENIYRKTVYVNLLDATLICERHRRNKYTISGLWIRHFWWFIIQKTELRKSFFSNNHFLSFCTQLYSLLIMLYCNRSIYFSIHYKSIQTTLLLKNKKTSTIWYERKVCEKLLLQ